MNPENVLQSHPVLLALDDVTRKRVMSSSIKKEMLKGEILVQQGEVWPYLFVIQKGKVVAEKDSAEGRTLIAATFAKGEMFWGLGFFMEDAAMPATLRVTENAELLLWSRRDLLSIIENNGKFSWELAKLAIQRMQQASVILESMTFHPIAVRLARLLIDISGSDRGNPIERNLTLDEMASRVGSTREMVCRLLYKFSDEGLIKINRTEFTIVDPGNLLSRAQK
jgi:CRP/FNR family transcriptional regulator, cyclic AMP receptor protein